MKIISSEQLREIMAIKGISIVELTRRVNALQKADGYTRRPMKPQAFRHYADHSAPPQERLYAIAAILKVHPKRIFKVVYNEELQKKYKDLASKVL